LAQKKVRPIALEVKREWIEGNSARLSIVRQCQLAGLHRSGIYYEPASEGAYNLQLMRLLDQQYLQTPFYGIRRMTAWLGRQGKRVNHKRVARLLAEMGLQAIYPKPRLTQPGAGHKVYPYLLRGVVVTRPDQVWATDITYVRLQHGFVYLVAVMDWFSRYVLAWEVSVTMDSNFCVTALDWALQRRVPEIFNSDQGSQFTSQAFTERLLARGVRISMDGRGRAMDNIFVERLWRSVKYEEVYLKDYLTVPEAIAALGRYFRFYNHHRLHQSLGYRTPAEVYAAAETAAW